MPVQTQLPEGLETHELNISPDSLEPYLEVAWGPVRVLALLDPNRDTVVDAAWASDHSELTTGGFLAGPRIGGLEFDAVKLSVLDLSAENSLRAWPTPVILGKQFVEQANFHIDKEHARWCVQA